jgi:hypothetical protein
MAAAFFRSMLVGLTRKRTINVSEFTAEYALNFLMRSWVQSHVVNLFEALEWYRVPSPPAVSAIVLGLALTRLVTRLSASIAPLLNTRGGFVIA